MNLMKLDMYTGSSQNKSTNSDILMFKYKFQAQLFKEETEKFIAKV